MNSLLTLDLDNGRVPVKESHALHHRKGSQFRSSSSSDTAKGFIQHFTASAGQLELGWSTFACVSRRCRSTLFVENFDGKQRDQVSQFCICSVDVLLTDLRCRESLMSPYKSPAQMLGTSGVVAQAQSLGCKVWSLASRLMIRLKG